MVPQQALLLPWEEESLLQYRATTTWASPVAFNQQSRAGLTLILDL
jgi:hypothetical protein